MRVMKLIFTWAENIPVGFNIIYISALKGWILRYSNTQLVPRQNSPRYLDHPTHKNIRRKLKECDYNNFYELQSKNLDFVEMLRLNCQSYNSFMDKKSFL